MQGSRFPCHSAHTYPHAHTLSLLGLWFQRASPRPDIILSRGTLATLISLSAEGLLARSTNHSSDSAQQILLRLSWELAHVAVCWVLEIIVIPQQCGILPDRPQHPLCKICWITQLNAQRHLHCLWREMFSLLLFLNDNSYNSAEVKSNLNWYALKQITGCFLLKDFLLQILASCLTPPLLKIPPMNTLSFHISLCMKYVSTNNPHIL